MLRTPLCADLGIEFPVMSAGMGPDISGAALAAAVSAAGGLGFLQAQLHPPELLRAEIDRVRALTDKPFGLNLILHFPHEDSLAVALDAGVPVISFFWGDARALIPRVQAAGAKAMVQVGSVDNARRAADAGVDAVIAQGTEAGGHVEGEVTTLVLVPRVVDAIAPVPVIAAGGLVCGRGLAAALALGAQAGLFGTRFLATPEANVHPYYLEALLAARETDTVRTTLFGRGWPNAPHRTLKTPFVAQWLGREEAGQDDDPDAPVVGTTEIAGREMPVHRFLGIPPNREAAGDLASMDLLAGQGVGAVNEVRPAGALVCDMAREAEAVLAGLARDAAQGSV